MRTIRMVFIYVVIILLLLVSVGFVYSRLQLNKVPPGYYYVNYVFDGDTIEVVMDGNKEKIRLIGVDTPETHKPDTPVECFGPEASEYTKKSLEGKAVRLEADPRNQNRDVYGRLLRYVYTEEGIEWNRELIRLGYGRSLTAFPFSRKAGYELVETEAKNTKQGLWSACE